MYLVLGLRIKFEVELGEEGYSILPLAVFVCPVCLR